MSDAVWRDERFRDWFRRIRVISGRPHVRLPHGGYQPMGGRDDDRFHRLVMLAMQAPKNQERSRTLPGPECPPDAD